VGASEGSVCFQGDLTKENYNPMVSSIPLLGRKVQPKNQRLGKRRQKDKQASMDVPSIKSY
jgi:hypothetical protein